MDIKSFLPYLINATISLIVGWFVVKFPHVRNVPPLKIPFWIILAIIFSVPFTIHFVQSSDNYISFETIEHRTFTNESIVLDGKAFNNCKFYRCTLIVYGEKPSQILNCELIEPIFALEGYAANTAGFFTELYSDSSSQYIVMDILNRKINDRNRYNKQKSF